MAEPKTRPTTASVPAFLASIENEQRRTDGQAICALMERLSGHPPVMWGDAIVGFGSYPQRYADGRSLDWPMTAFSPRKADLTLYVMVESARFTALLKRLGKHRASKACLYVKRLSDLDPEVLEALITESISFMRRERDAK